METRTLHEKPAEDSAPLTHRLMNGFIWLWIWAITIAVLALIFVVGLVGLREILSAFLSTELTVVFATAIPAMIVGVGFNPLRSLIAKWVEVRIIKKPIRSGTTIDERNRTKAVSPDLTGETLGSYEIQGLIGRGGMADVYRANLGENALVAIKIMHAHYLFDEENVERFKREGEYGLGMQHDHIAAVYELGKFRNVPYIVMEFVDGDDLRTVMQDGQDYTLNDVIKWMTDICDALDMAHSQGFVHRDIKPSNIMIRPSNDAVLMDFGIAKFANATSRITGASIGTVDYMSPEQIQNTGHIDHRADIYALGVVVYELLTSILPYEGTIPQVMYAHINYPPPDPRDMNPDIPEHVARAVRKALAKTPARRFDHAGDFARALNSPD